jgi:hypothetical protein
MDDEEDVRSCWMTLRKRGGDKFYKNKGGNVHRNVTLRRVRVSIVSVEKQ